MAHSLRWGAACGLLLTFVLPGSGWALAAAEDGRFSVRGVGAQTCSAIVAAFEESQDDSELARSVGSWIAGYLSHANRTSPGVFEVMPVSNTTVVTRLALNVCRANPDSLLEPAIAALIDSVASAVQQGESPLVEVESAENATVVRREVLRLAQDALSEQGLLPAGSADGAFGPQTRDALVEYQQSRGIPPTGVPDPVTLINLFMAEGDARPQ